MQRLPAASGLQWIRDGFGLLRRQPNELSLMFLLLVMVDLALMIIPVIGPLLVLVFHQAFTVAFMRGCAEADAGGKVRPRLLFAYLKNPTLLRLAGLAVLYLIAQLLAGGAMYLYDGGTLVDTLVKTSNGAPGPVDQATQEMVIRTLFFGMSVYAILIFPLWFAAPLIAWQNLGVAKAVFFSVVSVLRAIKAFIVFILAWAAIWLFVSINLTALLSLVPGLGDALALAVMIPAGMFLSMLLYCSFYPCYVELFGKPQLAPESQEPN